MKQVIISFILTICVSTAFAQEIFQSLTDNYADREGFSATMISSDMFDIYLKKRQLEEDSPISETLKKLDNILVVSQSAFGDEEETDLGEIHQEILEHYKSGDYILLKTQKSLGEDFKIYLTKSQDAINSLALVTATTGSVNLIEMNGEIDMVNISGLSKALNIRGLENLYKLNSSNSFGRMDYIDFNTRSPEPFYPDYEEFSKERMKNIEELIEKQEFLSQDQIKRIEQQAEEMAKRQEKLAEKHRQMAEKYGRQPIFLSAPGDTNTIYFLNGEKVKADKIKNVLPDRVERIQVDKKDHDGKNIIRIETK